MDKRSLTERDICTRFILPAVKRAGWDEMVQVREEVYFTKGRIIVRGKPDFCGGGISWLKSGELNDNRALVGSEETVTKLAIEKGSFRINKPGKDSPEVVEFMTLFAR